MKVAVTGGLSCGKSTVCRLFHKLGATVVSSDDIVHELLSHDTHIACAIENLCSGVCSKNELNKLKSSDGKINRKELASIAFSYPMVLKGLEDLLHPLVWEEIEKRDREAHAEKHPFFVAEVPLLFELGWDKKFDKTIAVIANREVALTRFFSPETFNRRALNQLPNTEKAAKADFVIDNTFLTIDQLEQEVQKIFIHLRSLAPQ